MLYESLSYFIIFLWLLLIYKKQIKIKTSVNGSLSGIFLITVFSARFILEYFKVRQSDFGNELFLSMGQVLSIPFIIAGVIFLIRAFNQNKRDILMKKT